MDNVIDFINVNRERYLDELKAFLAIPSISALPQHAPDVKRCAEWCAGCAEVTVITFGRGRSPVQRGRSSAQAESLQGLVAFFRLGVGEHLCWERPNGGSGTTPEPPSGQAAAFAT